MNKYYRKVPAEKLEQFMRFRQEHLIKKVELDGIVWEYIVSGDTSGKPLLLFPGGLSTAESAWRMIDLLEGENYRLVCPGYPPQVDSMSTLADGVAGILAQEGIACTFVIGGSYGGMVAQVFVRRHPGLVSKLILTHTYPPERSQAQKVQRNLPLITFLPLFIVKRLLRMQMAGILPKNPSPDLLLLAAQIHETLDTRLTRQAAMSTYLRMIDFDRLEFTPDDLAGWQGKLLILLAEDDPTTPEELRTRLIALYPGAKLHLFHGSGHATAILEMGEYLEQLKEFLSQDDQVISQV